jgi:hypothetical protein
MQDYGTCDCPRGDKCVWKGDEVIAGCPCNGNVCFVIPPELVADSVYEGGINVEDAHTLFDRVEDL